MNQTRQRVAQTHNRLCDRLGRLGGYSGNNGQVGLAFGQRSQSTFVFYVKDCLESPAI